MGIVGLLPLLKSITSDIHISEYKGLKVAIDAHGWLHRAIYSCGTYDIPAYTKYCTNLVELLLKHDIRPIVVFDGQSLPAKTLTSIKRRELREQYAIRAKEAEENGFFVDAEKYHKKTVVVSDDIVSGFIDSLRDMSIDYVVSPYEADAQLAFLSLSGIADVIITEDSDALVYGCQRVLFKLDSTGNGKEIKRCDLGRNTQLSFENWTDEQFKLFCCLSGCDYVPKLPNVGIKTAHRIASAHPTFAGVVKHLQKLRRDCDDAYFLMLARGLMTFSHQTVLDHLTGRIQHLAPINATAAVHPGTALHHVYRSQFPEGENTSFLTAQRRDSGGMMVSTSRDIEAVRLADLDLSFLGPLWIGAVDESQEECNDASFVASSETEVCGNENNVQYVEKDVCQYIDGRITPPCAPPMVPSSFNTLSSPSYTPSIQPINSPILVCTNDPLPQEGELDESLEHSNRYAVCAGGLSQHSISATDTRRKRVKKGDSVTLRQVLAWEGDQMFPQEKSHSGLSRHLSVNDDQCDAGFKDANNAYRDSNRHSWETTSTEVVTDVDIIPQSANKKLKRTHSVHQNHKLYPAKYIKEYVHSEDKSGNNSDGGGDRPIGSETLYRRKRRLGQLSLPEVLYRDHNKYTPAARKSASSCFSFALKCLDMPAESKGRQTTRPNYGSVRYSDGYAVEEENACADDMDPQQMSSSPLRDAHENTARIATSPVAMSESDAYGADGIVSCDLPWLKLPSGSSSCSSNWTPRGGTKWREGGESAARSSKTARHQGIFNSCNRIINKPTGI